MIDLCLTRLIIGMLLLQPERNKRQTLTTVRGHDSEPSGSLELVTKEVGSGGNAVHDRAEAGFPIADEH